MGREPNPFSQVSRLDLRAFASSRWVSHGGLCRFSGTTDAIRGDVARVKAICEPYHPGKYFFARNKQEEADLWAARKEALWTMSSIKPENHRLWSTDVAVPISRLAEIISS